MNMIKDYVKSGVPMVRNNMGEKRYTRDESIIFPNGWVASVIRPFCDPETYSVAVCNYDGYFDWDILSSEFETDRGSVTCNTEDEVCKVLEFIKRLGKPESEG